MKKIISVMLSVVMIATMFLGMTGCGKVEDKEIVGKWEMTVNLFDITGPLFDDDMELYKYIDADEFTVTLRYEFKRNGKYKFYADEKQLKESAETVREAIETGLEKFFQEYIEQKELDMTVDELLEASDMSMDSLIEDMFGEEIVQEFIDDFESEGYYTVKDGVLYTSSTKDVKETEENGKKYEIKDGQLTMYAPGGEEIKGYPLVLKRK